MIASGNFVFVNLAAGRTELVRLDIEPEKQTDTLAILFQCQRFGRPINWAAGMAIFADLSLCDHGIATVALSAAYDMCKSESDAGIALIKRNETVYSMAVAISPRMQLRAYRTLVNLYLHQLLTTDGFAASIEGIPEEFPWVVGFPWPCTAALDEKGRRRLLSYARMAAASVVNHCRNTYVTDVATDASPDEESPDSGAPPS